MTKIYHIYRLKTNPRHREEETQNTYSHKTSGRHFYTTFTNFSMKYLVMCKVYTDVCGIKQLYHVCPHERKIIHSLKLVDYLHVQADNPWYNYYLVKQSAFSFAKL